MIDNLSVKRTGKESIDLSWQCSDDNMEIAVFHGHSPDAIDGQTAVHRTNGSGSQNLPNLDPQKPHFFELMAGSGQRLTAGERRVPLEGAVNFRDLGGYETADGRRVLNSLLRELLT